MNFLEEIYQEKFLDVSSPLRVHSIHNLEGPQNPINNMILHLIQIYSQNQMLSNQTYQTISGAGLISVLMCSEHLIKLSLFNSHCISITIQTVNSYFVPK